jgi:hypothetical protein
MQCQGKPRSKHMYPASKRKRRRHHSNPIIPATPPPPPPPPPPPSPHPHHLPYSSSASTTLDSILVGAGHLCPSLNLLRRGGFIKLICVAGAEYGARAIAVVRPNSSSFFSRYRMRSSCSCMLRICSRYIVDMYSCSLYKRSNRALACSPSCSFFTRAIRLPWNSVRS